MNGQPGEKVRPDKRPGDVQDNVKAGNGRVTGVKSYKFTKSFPKITWKIMKKAYVPWEYKHKEK